MVFISRKSTKRPPRGDARFKRGRAAREAPRRAAPSPSRAPRRHTRLRLRASLSPASPVSLALSPSFPRSEPPRRRGAEAKRALEAHRAGAAVHTFSADVADADAVARAIERGAAAAGGVDALVCSAGITQPARFDDIAPAAFERMLRVNVGGCASACRAALPFLRAAGARHGAARVVLVSSQAGQLGVFGYTAYSASKFALRGLAEALQMEERPRGVLVTLAHPPDTDTPMLAEENKSKPRETALISETSGVFAADDVAASIARAMVSGTFLQYVGLDGWMLAHLTAGMSPVNSLLDGLAQVALMSVLRLVSLFYLASFDAICAREHRARAAKKEA